MLLLPVFHCEEKALGVIQNTITDVGRHPADIYTHMALSNLVHASPVTGCKAQGR